MPQVCRLHMAVQKKLRTSDSNLLVTMETDGRRRLEIEKKVSTSCLYLQSISVTIGANAW